MKLHLVDATFELFRAFYSPGRGMEFAPDRRPVNAVHGLVDSMLSLLREPDVTHIAAATDHVIESWRNDVFPGYKSSAGLPRELLSQIDVTTRAGRRYTERAQYPKGHAENPMTDADVDAKFRDLSEDALGRAQAAGALEPLWRLDEVTRMSAVVDLFAFKR